jgi:hypothetical protein
MVYYQKYRQEGQSYIDFYREFNKQLPKEKDILFEEYFKYYHGD